ncbi:MAG: 16S rRNA (guanine(527)-N(7))-methyltransferase RsmG [Hyphomicrobiales bacterium]
MPSGSDDAASPRTPPDVAPDLLRFESLIRPTLEQRLGTRAGPAFDLLARYGSLVHSQAEIQALVAKGDRPHLFTRHVLDSLNPLSLFERPPARALDVGTGAGFPGIPLAIVWPETRFTLLESRERKAGFVERATRELALTNVSIVCERLEDLGRRWRIEALEAIFVRAVGGLDSVLRYTAPSTSAGCRWVYFLGRGGEEAGLQGSLSAEGFASEIRAGLFGGRLLTGVL